MTNYSVNFEITTQSGDMFSHSETFVVLGLARVRVREKMANRFVDWHGIVRQYRATSSKPFVVCVKSVHTNEDRSGETVDHSGISVFAAVVNGESRSTDRCALSV